MTKPTEEQRKGLTDEISNELKTAWAAHCGIALDDDRAQEPDKCGWPEQFAIFRAGWDAAANPEQAALILRWLATVEI